MKKILIIEDEKILAEMYRERIFNKNKSYAKRGC